MALDIYSTQNIQNLADSYVVSLDYDLPAVQAALDVVQQETGLTIDVYGKNTLHRNHCQALLQGLNQHPAANVAAITALTAALDAGHPALFSFGD